MANISRPDGAHRAPEEGAQAAFLLRSIVAPGLLQDQSACGRKEL